MPTSSTSSTSSAETKDATQQETPTPPAPNATDECPVCHSLRGNAPEGLYDVHTSFGSHNNPGDPVWQMDYCWHCGAKYK